MRITLPKLAWSIPHSSTFAAMLFLWAGCGSSPGNSPDSAVNTQPSNADGPSGAGAEVISPEDVPRMDSAIGSGGSGGSTDGSIGDSATKKDTSTGDKATGVDVSVAADGGMSDVSAGTGPQSCANPVALTSTVGGLFWDMVVDDQFLYWYEFDNGNDAARVARVPVDGSGPAVDLFAGSCGGAPGAFASDVNNIYIMCYKVQDPNHMIEIMTIPKNGATPTPLFISEVGGLNLGVDNIGTNGTNVFFDCDNQSALYSIPVEGGTPTKLTPSISGAGYAYFIAFGGYLYWQGIGGYLFQMPVSGGTPALIANDDALRGQIDNMVIRDSYFYWRSPGVQALWRLPLAGGTPIELAAIPAYGSLGGQLEIFGNYIYFAEYDGSSAQNLILLSYPLHPADAVDAGDAGGVGTPTIIATIPRPDGFQPAARNHVVANSTHLFISDPANVGNNGHIYRCN